MVDAHGSLEVPVAVKLAKALEPFDIAWFEEPVSPENHRGQAEVRRATTIPIASGEREFTRYGGVRLDEAGRVAGFARRGPSSAGTYHFIGVQIVHAEAFDAVAPGEPASSIGGVYDALMASRPGTSCQLGSPARAWLRAAPVSLAVMGSSCCLARSLPHSQASA